jgi:hypothetical protein
MDAQIILVLLGGLLIGGLLTLAGVIAGAYINEVFQRRRDELIHARLVAENKRARLTESYTTTLLVAQQLCDAAHTFATLRYPLLPETIVGLTPAFVTAYTPLMLEPGQDEVIVRCSDFHKEFNALNVHEPPPADFDIGPFDRAYIKLKQILTARKAELDKIP